MLQRSSPPQLPCLAGSRYLAPVLARIKAARSVRCGLSRAYASSKSLLGSCGETRALGLQQSLRLLLLRSYNRGNRLLFGARDFPLIGAREFTAIR